MIQMNALIGESSPYLLQHAHNPVDWHPWGEAAFARARREDKPIFLSVGYSTCHWCHVMERESFANPAIAALLNRHFVSIKVDREERPDVDRVYMTYVQATTGGGGWPMSVWLTPDLTPFVGGTYFPPEDRWGRPGFRSVLWRIAEAWRQDRAALVTAGNAMLSRLRDAVAPAAPTRDGLGPGCLVRTCQALRASYDPVEGGFGGAPKFPRPAAPAFLLRYHARTGDQGALDMATLTLRKMAMGGMHDHLGGGFHRYAVDARWHVPHFEKMLYDQAQLACLYLDAFQITRDPLFARVARGILDYVRRDLTGEDGQFHSAEDADSSRPEDPSQHAEGAFYVWRWGEIVDVLGPEKAAVFAFAYGVEPEGNVRDDPHHEFRGRNILFIAQPTAAVAARFGLTDEQAERTLDAARECLFAARSGRPRPHLDDQAITAWNGLMISALARASQVLDSAADLSAARRAADFIRERLYNAAEGVLLRRYREGKAAVEGYADDYAFLIQGLIDLYEACFDVVYLEWAMTLQERQDACFRDEANGGYFCTSGRDPAILLRLKEGYDGAEPSANSVAALNLLRLADLLDRPDLRERALQTMAAFGDMLGRAPDAMPQMAAALAYSLDPPSHIVVAGRAGAADTQALLRVVHGVFRPHTRLVLADGGSGQERQARHLGSLRGLGTVHGRAAAYVCADGTCRPPMTDPEALRRELARLP